MDFFIASAYAQDSGAPAGGGLISFLPLIIIFGLFWFMLIRPQMKRQKEHRAMVTALQKGDEVVTSGGMLGKIIEVDESFATVRFAEGVEIKVQKHAVASVVPKGTMKSS